MRSLIQRAVFGAALVMLSAGTARAADVLEVNIPFAFSVEGQTLPAGEYRLERPFNDQGVMIVRAMDGAQEAFFVTLNAAGGSNPSGDRPVLTFTRGANGYVLAGVWDSRRNGYEPSVK
jgi:hypothetical protein